MKLSDKFANLGPGGLARRIAKEGDHEPREHAKPRPAAAPVARKPALVETPVVAAKANVGDRVKRWRKANPELYLERQRAYAKKHRAKRRAKEREE